MQYDYKDIEKISKYKIDSDMYTQLGLESTPKEIKQTKIKSKNIYKTISKVNPRLGKLFLQSMDN